MSVNKNCVTKNRDDFSISILRMEPEVLCNELKSRQLTNSLMEFKATAHGSTDDGNFLLNNYADRTSSNDGNGKTTTRSRTDYYGKLEGGDDWNSLEPQVDDLIPPEIFVHETSDGLHVQTSFTTGMPMLDVQVARNLFRDFAESCSSLTVMQDEQDAERYARFFSDSKDRKSLRTLLKSSSARSSKSNRDALAIYVFQRKTELQGTTPAVQFFADDSLMFYQYCLGEVILLDRAIRSRWSSLQKIAQALVEYQADYIVGRVSEPKPLTRKALAEQVGWCAETIGRAVQGLRLMTSRRGELEAGDLFRSEPSRDTELVASMVVDVLRVEPMSKPLSDEEIAAEIGERFDVTVTRKRVNSVRAILAAGETKKKSNGKYGNTYQRRRYYKLQHCDECPPVSNRGVRNGKTEQPVQPQLKPCSSSSQPRRELRGEIIIVDNDAGSAKVASQGCIYSLDKHDLNGERLELGLKIKFTESLKPGSPPRALSATCA